MVPVPSAFVGFAVKFAVKISDVDPDLNSDPHSFGFVDPDPEV